MSRKTQILIVSLMLITLSSFILNARSAEYEENLNNNWVDGIRDDHYSLMNSSSNATVYFANSGLRYAFFIESNESISTIQVNEIILSENLSTQDTNAVFGVNSAEIVLTRESMGENIHFSIRINGRDEIIVDPFSTLIPEEKTDPDPDPSSGGIELDLVAFFKGVGSSWFFWMNFAFFWILIADYNNHPLVKIGKKSGKMHGLGRFITESFEPKINKNRMLFLNSTGVQEVYCDNTLKGMDQENNARVYIIEWHFAHVLLTKLKLPKDSNLKKKEFDKTWQNKLIWGLFWFFRMTPFRWASLGLYNKLSYKETQISDVDLLIPYMSMKSIEYRYSITYQQKELNRKTNEEEYIKKTETNITWADILSLKKSQIKDLEYTEVEGLSITYPTLKAAIEDKQSRFEIINAYENRSTELEVKIFDLEKQLQLQYGTNQKLKLEMDDKIREQIAPFVEASDFRRDSMPEQIARALQLKELGFDEMEILQTTMKETAIKLDKENAELKKKNAELQAKNELLDKTPVKFNPNAITIKGD